MIRCPPYNQIYGPIGYAECIFIAKILPFFETENLMIEFGDLLGFCSPDRDMIDLPRLLPTIFSVALLNFRMLFPRNIELRSSRVVTSKDRKCYLFQPLGKLESWDTSASLVPRCCRRRPPRSRSDRGQPQSQDAGSERRDL